MKASASRIELIDQIDLFAAIHLCRWSKFGMKTGQELDCSKCFRLAVSTGMIIIAVFASFDGMSWCFRYVEEGFRCRA
jgi:hypothetical protein